MMLATGASTLATGVQAQTFPTDRVTFVVPFPPGASTDLAARILAEKLTSMWGQPVLIDNKGGANGIIAVEAVMRAKPDGHTILATSSMTHAGNLTLSLQPRAHVVLAHKGLGVKTLAELTARLKAEPGKHAFGAGTVSARVAAELYKMLIGSAALFVGYRNNQQAIPDIQSGRLSFTIIDLVGAKHMADNGYAVPLAVTLPTRMSAIPAVPTTAEAGLPGLVFTSWSGFYGPKGTPKPLAARLTASEIESWGKVICAAKLTVE